MKAARETGRTLKRRVFELLRSPDFQTALEKINTYPARRVINPLFSYLLSSDEEIRWRAVTAMGAVVAHLAQQNMESARVIMRRLIWMLNDESGGIGWGVPEAMGESIASHEGLAREYVRVLISYVNEEGNFLEYEPLQRGAVWAVARVAQARPGLVQEAIPHLIRALDVQDPAICGLAAWALGLLRAQAARPQIQGLLEDNREISFYVDGRLRHGSVSNIAKEALGRMDTGEDS
ncbi:MAG: HEAT repeat domain-containing protein [Thermodesulfobacteriota bacterium]|nr:HEAT repeat domain-containing protein [Thermodesulfobacteriota bacterium]